MICKLTIVDDPENLAYIDCTAKFFTGEREALAHQPLEVITFKVPISEEGKVKRLFTLFDKVSANPALGASEIISRKLEEAGFSRATNEDLNKSNIDTWNCFDVNSVIFDSIIEEALAVGLKMKYYNFQVDIDHSMLIIFEDLS